MFVEVPTCSKFNGEVDVFVELNGLIETDNVRVLQLHHRSVFPLEPVLHAKLVNFLLVQHFEGDWSANRFIHSH